MANYWAREPTVAFSPIHQRGLLSCVTVTGFGIRTACTIPCRYQLFGCHAVVIVPRVPQACTAFRKRVEIAVGFPSSVPPTDGALHLGHWHRFHSLLQVLDSHQPARNQEQWYQLGRMIIEPIRLPDGSEIVYGCKRVLEDPASANVSHQTFSGGACFPNCVFYRRVVHGVSRYEKHTDGGFTYSIADDPLIWGSAYGLWNTSVNRGAGSSKPIP